MSRFAHRVRLSGCLSYGREMPLLPAESVGVVQGRVGYVVVLFLLSAAAAALVAVSAAGAGSVVRCGRLHHVYCVAFLIRVCEAG